MSQTWRHLFQAFFLLGSAWLGYRLQADPNTDAASYPSTIDLYLPWTGLHGLGQWLSHGDSSVVPHPAAATLLICTVFTTLILKRGVCSWLCPVFPISEVCWRLATRLFGRTLVPPFWLDLVLRTTKYLLLATLVVLAVTLPLPAAIDPWLEPWSNLVPGWFWWSVALTLLVMFCVQNAWCRYLCPYGALLGLTAIFSLGRVQRDPRYCVRCHRCSHRCPAWLPVMQLENVRSPECFACYRCIDNCPAPGALDLKLGRHVLPAWQFGLALVLFFFCGASIAMVIH